MTTNENDLREAQTSQPSEVTIFSNNPLALLKNENESTHRRIREKCERILSECLEITVSDPDDQAGFKTADTFRKRLKRLKAEERDVHRSIKDPILELGRAVDSSHKEIAAMLDAGIKHLTEQCDIVRLKAAREKIERENARKAVLAVRVAELNQIGGHVDPDALLNMDDNAYANHYSRAKAEWEERQAEHEELLEFRKARAEKQRAEHEAAVRIREEQLRPIRIQLATVAAKLSEVTIPESLSEYRDRISMIIGDASMRISSLATVPAVATDSTDYVIDTDTESV